MSVSGINFDCSVDRNYSISNVAISEWFNYNIHDLQDSQTQSIISIAAMSLRQTNIFSINTFLSYKGLSILKQEIKKPNSSSIKHNISGTVFQDNGDLSTFPDIDHPRNKILHAQLGFTNRGKLPQSFGHLHSYQPLLSFLQEIIIKSGIYSNIYPSTDDEGSIYSLILDSKDKDYWHYDENPFTCIWMVDKPLNGGIFEYIVGSQQPLDIKKNIKTDEDYWNLLGLVYDRNSAIKHYIANVEVDEGGIYCFGGNNTLHKVSQVKGNKLRRVIVMAYAPENNWKHSEYVHNSNFVDGIIQ